MVHLIFVTKYRKPLLQKFGTRIKRIMYDIAEDNDIGIIEMEVDMDHIHMLIEYSPTRSVLQIVRLLKQISTYRVWQIYDEPLQKQYWRERTFWSDGYFACSIGQVSEDVIREYIQTQG